MCLLRFVAFDLKSSKQVLFLDEATSALDEKTEQLFQRVLEEKFADCTIICIAHRLETLRWCRTRIEMDKGKVLSMTQLPSSREAGSKA